MRRAAFRALFPVARFRATAVPAAVPAQQGLGTGPRDRVPAVAGGIGEACGDATRWRQNFATTAHTRGPVGTMPGPGAVPIGSRPPPPPARPALVRPGRVQSPRSLPADAVTSVAITSHRDPAASQPAVVELESEAAFSAVVAASQTVAIIVALYSNACPHSAAMLPKLEQLARSSAGRLVIARLNVDALPGLAQALGATATPTLVAVSRGDESSRLAGAATDAALADFVRQFVSSTGDGSSSAPEPGPDPRAALDAGFLALATGAPLADAARAFAPLVAPASPPMARAASLAGLACVALAESPPAIDTARGLIADARAAAGVGGAVPEIAMAEARLSLRGLCDEAGADPSREDEPSVEDESSRAAAALRADALARWAAGDAAGGLESALTLVTRHRAWGGEAGRSIAVLMLDALGPRDAGQAKGRRRLHALWFC